MNERQAFAAFIADRRTLGFSWEAGRDCCLLAADALVAMGQPDFAHDLRGYTTKRGAIRALLKANFLSVGHVMNERFVRVNRPRLGTVVMLTDPPFDVLLVCEGAQACWGQDHDGLVRVPIPDTAKLWEPKCRQS